MSSISSLSSSSTVSPYQKLGSLIPGGVNSATQNGQGPTDFASKIDSALESQGVSGTKLSDLRTQIQQAIDQAKSSSDGTTDPRDAIKSAVDNVLKNSGVDASKFDAAIKPKGGGHHHHTKGAGADQDSSNDPSATNATSSTSTTGNAQFDALLQSKGIDPEQFKSTLFASLDNGTDIGSAFAGAGTGSDVDLYA